MVIGLSQNMTTRQKLEVIQETLNLTQTKCAERLGVSFAAYNGWWTGKSKPRPKALVAIDDLFNEVTGQKTVSKELLNNKKRELAEKTRAHKKIVAEILANPDLRDEFILKLTYNSNSIEGSSMTEPDTAAVLFDNAALPNCSLTEQLEAKNHQTALNFLFDHLLRGNAITEDLVLRLHGMLMNGVRSDAGFYRRHAVRIVGVNLPTANYLRLPDLVPPVIAEAAGAPEDIIKSVASVHSHFEQLHPFSDGNGRIGRLLMTAMLLKADHAPAIIRQEKKRLYYTYLYKAQTSDDQSQLENYICDAVADGFRILERRNEN